MTHLTDIFVAVLIWGVALFSYLRPVIIIGWAKRAHPDISEDDETVLRITRLIGFGILGVATFFSVIVVRSFSGA